MRIAVYGLGRLGYPLFNVLARAGHEVVGVDPAVRPGGAHRTRASSMKPSTEPRIDWTGVVMETSTAPTPADMSFVVVPTPSLDSGDRRGGFDSTHVEAALRQIHNVNEKGHVAVIVSTVSPGTCDRLAERFSDLNLVYNPTFIALGEVVDGLLFPNLLLVGGAADGAAGPVIAVRDLWRKVFLDFNHPNYPEDVTIHVASYTEVELIKLAVNAALGTKISLANSLGHLFEAWGVDPKAVEVVGRDPRIGTAYFTPGSPITGPCLPRDNQALVRASIERNVELPLAVATDRVNSELLYRLLQKIKAFEPETVGILGTSYKYGVDVETESVASWLRLRLENLGIEVRTYDDLLGGDVAAASKCDVLVVTQREYQATCDDVPGTVIDIWA